MAQSTVFLQQGFGVPGDVFDDSPNRAQAFTILSDDAANNVFGRAFSTGASAGYAKAGGTAPAFYLGIMVGSKNAILYGTQAGGTLAPTLTIPNYSISQICSMGEIIVTLPGAFNVGDLVIYHTTTGVLDVIPQGDDLPVNHAFAQATVTRYSGASGLAVIELTPTLITPVPA